MIAEKRKTVEQIGREKRRRRQVALALAIIFAVLLLGFLIAAINEKVGNFTINLSYLHKDEGISIYDNVRLENPTTRLDAEPVKTLFNITYSDIAEKEDMDTLDGAHNYSGISKDGDYVDFYMGYTFYVCNYLHASVSYDVQIEITKSVKGAADALRVMVIDDSDFYMTRVPNSTEHTFNAANKRQRLVYAAPAKPGTPMLTDGREPDNETGKGRADVNFEKSSPANEIYDIAMLKTKNNFLKDQVHKYTVIIYLEGWDPQCVDSIVGGSIKMNMRLTVNDIVK